MAFLPQNLQKFMTMETTKTVVVTTIADLAKILKEAKNGGQFTTLYGATHCRLNKYARGCKRTAENEIDPDFTPVHVFSVSFNFGKDYEKAMTKALGEKYEKDGDENRETIVKNLLMRYKSTNNWCFIYMPNDYKSEGYSLHGKPLTAEQLEYFNKYKSSSKSGAPVDYRTIGLKNVKKIVFGGCEYIIDLNAIGVAV